MNLWLDHGKLSVLNSGILLPTTIQWNQSNALQDGIPRIAGIPQSNDLDELKGGMIDTPITQSMKENKCGSY